MYENVSLFSKCDFRSNVSNSTISYSPIPVDSEVSNSTIFYSLIPVDSEVSRNAHKLFELIYMRSIRVNDDDFDFSS